MAYVKTKMGPGDIAALPPTIGLSNRPTISANDMPRTISGLSPRPYAPPPLSGSGLGDLVNPFVEVGVLTVGFLATVIVGAWWLGRNEGGDPDRKQRAACEAAGRQWIPARGTKRGYAPAHCR